MKNLTIAFFLFLSATAYGQNMFFPKNDLRYPVTRNDSIKEADFQKVIDDLNDKYQDFLMKEYGKTVTIVNEWQNDEVNGYIFPTASGYEIHLFGGLARHPEMTLDGLMLVGLHEFGHAIGGAPMYARYGKPEWASNEGGSDYYATGKGAKHMFSSEPITTFYVYDNAFGTEIEHAKQKCDSIFKNEFESAVCVRSSMAGLSLARVLDSFSGKPKVSLLTPSKEIAKKTNVTGYPATQCRLDTYFQGALCDKDVNILPLKTDESTGWCTKKDGYIVGVRPACWYVEK